jgi:hypothetical protein
MLSASSGVRPTARDSIPRWLHDRDRRETSVTGAKLPTSAKSKVCVVSYYIRSSAAQKHNVDWTGCAGYDQPGYALPHEVLLQARTLRFSDTSRPMKV